MQKVYRPIMGGDQCRYVFDGKDTDDTRWYRCTVHDSLAIGHEVPCDIGIQEG